MYLLEPSMKYQWYKFEKVISSGNHSKYLKSPKITGF